jgi:hypothetical protein
MNGRTLIIGLIVVAGALAAANALRPGAQTAPRRDPLANGSGRSDDVLLPRVRTVPKDPQSTEATPRKRVAASVERVPMPAPPTPAPAPADTAKPKQPKKKEKTLDRYALAYVGADSTAESIWLDAINDPDVSAHDRSDLIEDLNESGFEDPAHVQPHELPIVLNRLALIENLAPGAMDDTNAAAFAEAYKDLVNMYERTSANAAAAAAAAAASEQQAAEAQAPEGPAPVAE